MQTNATLKTSYISIHALREEGDCAVCNFGRGIFQFLSTPSARRATPSTKAASRNHLRFLSTPSARRATDDYLVSILDILNFYPRPPRGGRLLVLLQSCGDIRISIHALREEGDGIHIRNRRKIQISIHALREEGDRFQFLHFAPLISISIHALREEGDDVTFSL